MELLGGAALAFVLTGERGHWTFQRSLMHAALHVGFVPTRTTES
jgi:hypothetical protein